MKRKIEFISQKHHWKNIGVTVFTFLGINLSFNYFGLLEFSFQTLLIFFTFYIGFYSLFIIKGERHLTEKDGDFFIHDIVSDLQLKKSLFKTTYVEVTSQTKSGYHRIKVYPGEVSEQDWTAMMKKCT